MSLWSTVQSWALVNQFGNHVVANSNRFLTSGGATKVSSIQRRQLACQPVSSEFRGCKFTSFQEQKSSPKRKLSGRICCGHRSFARISWTKTSVRALETLGKQAFQRGHPWPKGADVHDLKDFQKLRSEKLWAEFSFLKFRGRVSKTLVLLVFEPPPPI